jgi:PAS domain S-box-containing protein
MKTILKESLSFLKGGGEMGELIRNKNWENTSLGAPENWPQSLRITVNLLLNSRFPMFIWWGPEMITLYNDAYRIIAGEKHPAALGESGHNVWPEIWDVISPLAHEVMDEGKSNWAEDQLLHINRHGYIEECYFTFSYSPVYGESGEINGVFCACTETTEKVLATRKIRESENNLRNMIIQSPVAMCILRSSDFIVEIANQRMHELWGKSEAEILNQPIFKGLPEAAEQGLEEILQQVFETGSHFAANERPIILPRNGRLETAYINFVYEPLHEADGSITGIMAVAIDVTEQVKARKKIEENEQDLQDRVEARTYELERKNEELKKSNVNLEEFAYAASHDMKEPIRKVHYFSDRLKKSLADKMNDDERYYFERMETASRRMHSLIEDLLSYSEVSVKPRAFEDVDMNDLFKLVLSDLDLEIEHKNATIHVDELFTIKGHQRQLQQVFQNLIGNALKYSKPDIPPIISINCDKIAGEELAKKAGRTDLIQEYYVISIEDNGIGFDQKDAERIFNVFTRLHGNAEYKGTGIGLSIVKKIIDNHNGFILAESEAGKGATFKVFFPA